MPTNKKKKKSSRHRSAAAVFCGSCQKKLNDPNQVVRCVCTKINFCSPSCRDGAIQSGQHICTGPPSNTNRIQSRPDLNSPLEDPATRDRFNQEYQDTIQQHIRQVTMQEAQAGRLPPDNPGPDYYARLADRGNQVYGSAQCAYMAGILYKNRMVGNLHLDRSDGSTVLRSEASENADGRGVLETDELAFKYLKQASNGGIAIAMESLAELYEKGQGVRERRISGNNWLWRSTLLGSSCGIKYLDSKSLLPLELNSMLQQLRMIQGRLGPMQGCNLSGPHLTSLLCNFCKELLTQFRFKLPAFASSAPTLTVGNGVGDGETGPVPIIGSQIFGEICLLKEHLERRGNNVNFIYGRRGIAKEATAQVQKDVKRRIADSFLYKVPPEPQCDDEYTENERSSFQAAQRVVRMPVHCIHSESGQEPGFSCVKCLKAAIKRLKAISHGSVAISLYETLPARGLTALWLDEDGKCQSETFKVYSRGEAEVVLASLVACEPRLAHPLFVAQDPNFLWPLITYHGTIRAALEYVAPHVDWDARLGVVKPMIERRDIAAGALPGKIVSRCGNSVCKKIELRGRYELLKDCRGCKSRPYCSMECAASDWIVHKHECSGGSGEGLHAHSNNESTERAATIRAPREGEEVVVHGLVAKPEYNGCVGVINGELRENGRYPMQLTTSSTVLVIKPANIYQLGVSILEKEGGATKARCAVHRQEVCDECSMDFGVVNHIFKLRHQGQSIDSEKVEEVAALYFAGIKVPEESEHDHLKGDFPLQCAGLEGEKERFILESLLNYTKDKTPKDETVSREVWLAVNGLSCYSARKEAIARPSAMKQLENI